MKNNKTAVFVSVIIEKNDDGYLASVPSLQGAFAEGDTIEAAIFNCGRVIRMVVSCRFLITAAKIFAKAPSLRLFEKLV